MRIWHISIVRTGERLLIKMKRVVIGLVLVISAGMALCVFAVNCFAEQITFTTYYPSPYGTYTNLEVRGRFAVGDIATSGLPGITRVDSLSPGEFWVEDSFILGGHASDPAVASSKEGELIYNSTEGQVKFFDGTQWSTFQRGSGSFFYSTKCGWYAQVRNCWYCNGSCTPAACLEGDTDLGVSCPATYTAYLSNSGCTWGICERFCLDN